MSLMTKAFFFIGPALAWAAVGTCVAATPRPPEILGPADGLSFVVPFSDGSVYAIFSRTTSGCQVMACKRSTDNGRTWSATETLYQLSAEDIGTQLYSTVPLATIDGGLQLFTMVGRGTGSNPGVDRFIDIRQTHAPQPLTDWHSSQRIFEGYVGAINGVVQLRSGRIVLPFACWVGGRPSAPPTGSNVATVVYSDDNGDTWRQSPARLTAPCYDGYNGNNYGAIEPTIIQLADDRAWMLMRTQTGFLYESFSLDGANWSPAVPSRFRSSSSPAGLTRLPDGRIVLFWNNCENTSRIEGKLVYTTRDVLHAAISSDDGKTWRGYREVYLDPYRNQSPPATGDFGTAYPYPTAIVDGKIILVTGQGADRRKMLLVDPDWLEQIGAEDDFSQGLDGWSVFKPYGEPVGAKQARVQGAELVDHPAKPGAKVLHVRRPDDKDGDEAVWNFPAGREGTAAVKLLMQPGCQGISLTLADRYIQPNDAVGRQKELFRLSIDADGLFHAGTPALTLGGWHTFTLEWNLDEQLCKILLDDQPVCSMPMLNAEQNSPGISYLRLHSTAQNVDEAGMIVEWVRAGTAVPEPSAFLLLTTATVGLLAYAWKNRNFLARP
ncbi:MAG: exo-alpha-sialidase [Pirellulaceae bacterium]|nr:exo-alpha-sialidase [Pirellulaceae bacterium]